MNNDYHKLPMSKADRRYANIVAIAFALIAIGVFYIALNHVKI